MRSALGRTAAVLVAASVVLFAACASSGSSRTRTRSDSSLITREQIDEHHFTNAYDAVAALHANWLNSKGTDSFQSPSQIRVYVDNTFVGGVDALRQIDANTIRGIRHYTGVQATARWGMDHGQGVIQITTVR
jgi:hypothetical protein